MFTNKLEKKSAVLSAIIWLMLLVIGPIGAKAAVTLFEDFEDGVLDARISIETAGEFNSAPGIKNVTNFGSAKAFGFGRSSCGASCFSNFQTILRIHFGTPTHVTTISFKEMELYGNWGSGGKIFIDGQPLTGGIVSNPDNHDFGRLPYNDGVADTTYRSKSFPVGTTVTVIELISWDITSGSEIFIDDLLIESQPPCIPPPSGMVAWWKAENTSSDTLG